MPDQPDLHFVEQSLRQALAMQPGAANLWNQLGSVLRQQGRAEEAVPAAQRAVSLDPNVAQHWANLGNAHYQASNLPQALAAYQQALARDASDVNIWNNLASTQIKAEDFAGAQASLERALALGPAHPGAVSNYAFLLCQLSRKDEAARWLEDRLGMNPHVAEAWIMLGEVWQMMGETALAESTYRHALTIEPRHPTAQYQLARMLRLQRRLAAAEVAARELLDAHPHHADGWALLGELVSAQGRPNEAIPPLQHAVEIAPNDDRHARLLTALQYYDQIGPEELLTAHQAWDAAYARPLMPPNPPVVVENREPLRIGFLSADFGRHPTGFLVLPALEHLDPDACSITCYSDRANEDEYTARFRAAAHHWRNISTQSDEFIAKQITYDRIDVLVDLMGHTGKRLLVFARKPAPVQTAWLGYVGTTGLTCMDGLIADPFHIRDGEERFYSERILRMPHDYVCYQPPLDAPGVSSLPASSNGYFTFGCFNNAAKYSPRLLDAWTTILQRVPNSQLLLKANGLDDPPVAARFQQFYQQRGITPDRIQIEGWSPPAELMARYHRVDLALDTLPYSGGLTTCESLWMGVPVITCPGRTFAGRHSTSHLTNAGCGQFVAADLTVYIDLAVRWANNLHQLASLRSTLRDQTSRSPLCDAPQFAADFLSLLRNALTTTIKSEW